MSEISHYFSRERLEEHGEEGYQYYLEVAQTSTVPPFFVDVSNAYLFNLPEFRGNSIIDIARLLFNTEFESERDAWFALNYAQAVAIVKKEADDNNGTDSSKMLAGVGVAVLLEKNVNKSLEDVKDRVEDVFANPRESLRVARMYEDLRLGSSNN